MSDRKPGSGWAKQKGGLVGFVEGPACSARRTAQDARVQTAPSGSVPSVACSAVFRAGFIPRQGRSCGRSCPPSGFSGKGGPRFSPLGVFRAFLSFLPLELQAGGLTWNQLWLSVC